LFHGERQDFELEQRNDLVEAPAAAAILLSFTNHGGFQPGRRRHR